MDLTPLIGQLQRGPGVIGGMLDGLDPKAMRWRPAPGKWSALEVICHLADEERQDFRLRLDLTLHQPGREWPAIDPPAWVSERAYQDREPSAALEDFMHERAKSLIWLQMLESPDWDLFYEHPQLGRISAGDLLSAWAAHDLLHLRQLTRLRFMNLEVNSVPYQLAYAGAW
mgnify:CR=1 FL=1